MRLAALFFVLLLAGCVTIHMPQPTPPSEPKVEPKPQCAEYRPPVKIRRPHEPDLESANSNDINSLFNLVLDYLDQLVQYSGNLEAEQERAYQEYLRSCSK